MQHTTIAQRIESLRQWMRGRGISAFITPSTDPHSGEYVPDHWKSREWISGFNGSAGTAVVTLTRAALWTDNRYFLAAAEQLEGTEYELMKIGLEQTPTIGQWLAGISEELRVEGQPGSVGIDGTCFTLSEAEALQQEIGTAGLSLSLAGDPYDDIWTDRPRIPVHPVELHAMEYAGEDVGTKLQRIRRETAHQGAEWLVISMLDEVAWTLNLRGTDVAYNPVFVSYLLVGRQDATLYVQREKITSDVAAFLQREQVAVKDYDAIFDDLAAISQRVLIQADKTNVRIVRCLQDYRCGMCPVTSMKIMKNEAEIRGYRSAMLKDGIAMVKWMKWALEAIPQGGQTELSLSRRLYQFRAEQPLFRGDSFETIMGYAAHGAIVHYEPTPETDVPVLARGLLLCDSGGQYEDGTTDVTRTLPLGELTEEERRDYTLVLRGFLRLANAVFPRGTYGSQLDVLAREPMWKYGTNYLHGTGHGVGSYLNVHEGPHQFRMNYMPQSLLPGMTITCEPGIYITDRHGVRHENTLLIVPAMPEGCDSGEGRTFGPYYAFSHLTLCPILTSPIVREMMQPEEIVWFNTYQQYVYDQLVSHLDDEHRQWLFEATRPI